jgi:thioredoxin 1
MYITFIIAGSLIAGFIYLVYVSKKIRNTPEAPQSAKVITLTTSNFQQHIGSGITLVDFWAAWCMPCKMMSPILNEVAEQVDGKAKICKLNIDDHKQVAAKYSVRSIPTLLIFKNGKLVDRIVGVKTRDFLVNKIDWIKNK